MTWDLRGIEGLLYCIPLLPFLGAATIGLFGKRLPRASISLVACASVAGAALLSALILLPMSLTFFSGGHPVTQLAASLGVWFRAGTFTANASFLADHLSTVLALVVSGVGFLIHLYSTEYMAEDSGYARYFAYLNLFVGFMLLLVLADNLVLMFVGWEGVGLCSYLLIGFWYEDDLKATAGRKAFVVNRIGDFGFLLGLFTLFALFGSLDIQGAASHSRGLAALAREIDPSAAVPSGVLASLGMTYGEAITAACLFLFLGATGKSAQLPLYVWLPDAMAGPTPVSALIHAATMVTAGVYLVARMSFLFALSPTAMATVASIGAATALMAALMGFAQNDIKKVLAYSTISQLGFMILGVGIGAHWQAVFHLVTHAFFKACLFLGAGAVILGCHHQQDIRKMGGLRRRMPVTAFTFLVATLAITGVAPLSGFFSKDAILHFAHGARLAGHPHVGEAVYLVGSLAALCTAFYMFRLYFLVFEGDPRSEEASHARDRGRAISLPLWTLAFFSVFGAAWGLPFGLFQSGPGNGREMTVFENFMLPIFGHSGAHHGLLRSMAIAWALALAGFGTAWWLYRKRGMERLAGFLTRGPGRYAHNLVANKFYVDEIYQSLVVAPFAAVAHFLWEVVDVFAIDTVGVRGTAQLTARLGAALRLAQNGDVQRYASLIAIGAVALIWAMS
jgi:NADH-quinone oxidoreductase subunit L